MANNSLKEIFHKLFEFSLYARGWGGPESAYPIKRTSYTDHDINDELTYVKLVELNELVHSLPEETLDYFKTLKVVDRQNNEFVDASTNIFFDRDNSVYQAIMSAGEPGEPDEQNRSMFVASTLFMYTAYHYLKKLFDEELDVNVAEITSLF